MIPQCANCIHMPELFDAMMVSLKMFKNRGAYAQFWKNYQDYPEVCPMTPQQAHRLRCETCKYNYRSKEHKCPYDHADRYYSLKEEMRLPKGAWLFTSIVGCASHSAAAEQCPHWKDSSNLKSDCRDQGIGGFYCNKPATHTAASKPKKSGLDEWTYEEVMQEISDAFDRGVAVGARAECERLVKTIINHLTEKVEPKEAMYRLLGIEGYLESLRDGGEP